MHTNKYIIFNIILVLAFPLMAQEEDKENIRDILLGRFQKLHNLIVEYKLTTEFHLPPDMKPESIITKREGGFTVINSGIRMETKEFSVLGNRMLYDQRIDSWDRKIEHPDLDKIPYTERIIIAFNTDRIERIRIEKDSKIFVGEIRNDIPLPEGDIEYALGLRKHNRTSGMVLLMENDLNDMTLDLSNNDHVILIDIEADRGVKHEWTFDKKLEYALTCHRMFFTSDSTYKLNYEYVMEDFKSVDGILLPFKMHGMQYYHSEDGKRYPVQEHNIKVAQYRLNDEENTPERYHIKWPKGTRVIDTILGIRFLAEDIPPSLLRKPLPELKDLGFDLTLADVNEKSMLVCFFDYEQRPSRNDILELSKKAQEIESKDIEIFIVRASTIEQATLDEWLKDENINFEAQMLEGDFNKQQYALGVKALPWLVLTDKNHIVKAEGFNINELDEKIKTLTEE